jgi:hypothetical protein
MSELVVTASNHCEREHGDSFPRNPAAVGT